VFDYSYPYIKIKSCIMDSCDILNLNCIFMLSVFCLPMYLKIVENTV